MDRVGFLIEATGERLGCLLNPETLEITRRSGLRTRRSLGGALTGRGLSDDPVLYTGGGVTELKLDLLFDVALSSSTHQPQAPNVRELTAPFWELAENSAGDDGFGHAPQVRFVWGKVWNVPAVVLDIAERFEQFTPEGVPQRSWVRMRLRRVPESVPSQGPAAQSPQRSMDLLEQVESSNVPPEQLRTHEIVGGSAEGESFGTGERLDEVAQSSYGDASLWRLVAAFNQIDDPLRVSTGQVLRLPPLEGPASV